MEFGDAVALQLRSDVDWNEYVEIEGSFFTSNPDFTAHSATVEVTGSTRYWGAGLSALLSPEGDMKFEPFGQVSARYLNASVEVLGTTVSGDGFESGFGAGVNVHPINEILPPRGLGLWSAGLTLSLSPKRSTGTPTVGRTENTKGQHS